MAFEIILKNNFLLINDLSTGLQHEALAKDVLIRKLQPASESYAFVGVVGMSTTPIPFTELRNGAGGSVWASVATWETWYTENLGKSSSGGSGTPSELISADADNALELGGDDKLFVPQGGGGVETVTGTTVNNDDLANPVVGVPTLKQITTVGANTDAVVKFYDGASVITFNGEIDNSFSSETKGTKIVYRAVDGSDLGEVLFAKVYQKKITKSVNDIAFDGVETVFTVPHGMTNDGGSPSAPLTFTAMFSDNANSSFTQNTILVDDTNVTFTCLTPPVGGMRIWLTAFE